MGGRRSLVALDSPLERSAQLGGEARAGRGVATLLHELVERGLLLLSDVRLLAAGRAAAAAAAAAAVLLPHRARLGPRSRQLDILAFGSFEPNKAYQTKKLNSTIF